MNLSRSEKRTRDFWILCDGGIFGEGIDLKEDSLIGAIIVGTGIPQICREREILKQYYDGRNEDGFAYAYRYPGMNKVLQSAGRVIRTAQDRGVVLLLDEALRKVNTGRCFRENGRSVSIAAGVM